MRRLRFHALEAAFMLSSVFKAFFRVCPAFWRVGALALCVFALSYALLVWRRIGGKR